MKRNHSAFAIILVGLFIAAAALPRHATKPDKRISIPADTLESRPLRFLMVGLGQDMGRIADGLWHEDYEMIAAGAQGVADHPRIPAEEMMAIKNALGDRFGSFVGFDQSVHLNATELVRAAESGKMKEVLDVHARLQQGCISCHTTFREEVRAALY